MELLGHEYFEELKSRSFFQHSVNDEVGYTMHDLINDLATSVAREFSFRLDGEMDVCDTNETFDKFRHFSLVGPRSGSYRKLRELQRAKQLRTFLLMSIYWEDEGLLDKALSELLPELQLLRVLSVTDLDLGHHIINRGSFIITKVPQSIGSLKHLRYLNFSYTNITCLPEQVSDLYNLQSLLVHDCRELSNLPESFAKLINLRHIDISNSPKVNKMPLGIDGLTSLQTLTKVIIEEANSFKISDLKGLKDLQGQISIIGLDKVINPMQAKDANLHQKKGLDVLEMKWSDVCDDSGKEMIQYEVHKELRPSSKLKNLKILFYNGTRFPSWVGDPSFDELTELTLHGSRSTYIPTLGHLRSLKKLVVERMNEVKTIGFELLAPTNSPLAIAFPSLEILKFINMQGWQSWSIYIGSDQGTPTSFPCLREISIECCLELAQVSIGLIPSLRVLNIKGYFEAVLRSMVGVSSSLVELKILNVKGFTQLHGADVMHLGAVECLHFERCDDFRYLWEPKPQACNIFGSSHNLDVCNCKKSVSLTEKEVNLGISMGSLKIVIVHNCDSFESYSCPNTVERLVITGCDSMTSLTFSTISDCDFGFLPMSRLTSLHISCCKNLKSFPHEHFQSLTSLEDLWIHDCPSIDYSFACGLWPPNLSKLKIGRLNKPMSEWGPQNFPTSLVDLWLYGENSGVVSFAVADNVKNIAPSSFLLPTSLVSLM